MDYYSWDDEETMNILKANDLNTGDLLKTCGPHVARRQLFFRDTTIDPDDKYLPVTIVGYNDTSQRHQLQPRPDPSEPSPSSTAPFFVDLSKSNVRLVRPQAADVAMTTATEMPASSPTVLHASERTGANPCAY